MRSRAKRNPAISRTLRHRTLGDEVRPILAFDRECRYTVWNPAMERITGLKREQVLGRCAFDVFPFLRRRGEVALVGMSTAIATPPTFATGRLGKRQLRALGGNSLDRRLASSTRLFSVG